MIHLVDLSAVFFVAFYGHGDATKAYDATLERVGWYRDNCDHTVVCCDGGKLKRKDWYPDYKATRKPAPEEAIDSLRAVQQQIDTWGMPRLTCPGYEADDVIATLVDQAFLDDVRIVSQDKDLYQLINEQVRLVGKRGEIGIAECVDKFGVTPVQMTDYLTLCGDACDNIPGLRGCGPGRARDLLQRFGTLPAILAATDDELLSVSGFGDKTLASLRAWDPTMARKLVTLLTDAPVDFGSLWKEVA